MAGWDGLEKDYVGYILVFMNNLAQSLFNIVVQKGNKTKDIGTFGVNFYFACCGLVWTTVYLLVTGEAFSLAWMMYQSSYAKDLNCLILMSGLNGIFLTVLV